MSGYIKADVLMEVLERSAKDPRNEKAMTSWANAFEELTDLLEETLIPMSTADVPQWIPCNEKLPPCDGDYLVTLDFAWGKEIEMGEWFEGEWINPNSHVTVAWMPLPKPWERREDATQD